MRLIIDTTVLRADPFFKNTEMIKLRKLCGARKIELIIPEIAMSEYLSQEKESFIDESKNLLEQVKRKVKKRENKTICEAEKNILKEMTKDLNIDLNIDSFITSGEESINYRIGFLISGTNANIITPTVEDYEEAFRRYFAGEKPFKKRRAREDIPDSIIFLQVLNAKKNEKDELVFVSNDNNLRKTVESENITVFSKLSDFMNSEVIAKVVEIHELEESLYSNLFSFIESEKLKYTLCDAIEKELLYKTVIDESIPDDNKEGIIDWITNIHPIEFVKNEIIKFDTDIFTLSFSCEIDAYLEYYIFKSDYYSLDEDRIKGISINDWNDHYFQAEEEYSLICTGKLGLQFDSNLSNDDFTNPEVLLQELKISFSEIEIKIKDF